MSKIHSHDIKFGNPYFSDTDNYEKLEEREVDFVINDIKTTITCKFNKGYLAVISSMSSPIREEIKPTKAKKAKDRFIKKRG